MTEESRKLLLRSLPRKWEDMVAKRCRKLYSKSHIRNVIEGRRNNLEILQMTIDIAFEHKKRQEQIDRKIQKLLA